MQSSTSDSEARMQATKEEGKGDGRLGDVDVDGGWGIED